MFISQSTILAERSLTESREKSAGRINASASKTAFLSHSHKDQDLATATQKFLAKHGLYVYIDWQDSTMPDVPNGETASKIQTRIKSCELFLFLVTENSKDSAWCPWELGYADLAKSKALIYIIPTTNGSNNYGNEYLELYRHIGPDKDGSIQYFQPGFKYNGSGPIVSML